MSQSFPKGSKHLNENTPNRVGEGD
ncbi:Protein of unknown function [Bacillus cytotoxicus]|uniref:Uncharacterized protein n=1 Tax=Bacillus cytotoxicus TaxID=580165 RepID=A0AAX2CMD6_9BACI|nr:Protein of unknown function [Bacillus cytotoxicus]